MKLCLAFFAFIIICVSQNITQIDYPNQNFSVDSDDFMKINKINVENVLVKLFCFIFISIEIIMLFSCCC